MRFGLSRQCCGSAPRGTPAAWGAGGRRVDSCTEAAAVVRPVTETKAGAETAVLHPSKENRPRDEYFLSMCDILLYFYCSIIAKNQTNTD